MNFDVKKMLGLACTAAALALLAPSCGPEEGSCEEGQTLASVNGGPEQCYTTCDAGMCPDGFSCQSGLCVAGGSSTNNNNNTNNTSTNNDNNTNNTSTNNDNNTNNTSTNNDNNTTSTNNDNNTTGGPPCPEGLDPAIGPCDPICETGCMMGQACAAGSAGPGQPLQSQCQPAGPGMQGDTCDQMNGCASGFGCIIQMQGDTSGICQEYCKVGDDSTCSAADATCGETGDPSGLGICVVAEDACDPFDDMCPMGEKCAQTNLGLQCFATAGGQAGDTCDTSNTMMAPCDKGLICAQVGQATTCRVLCDPNDGSNCTGGTTCQAGQDPNIGICL